MKVIEAKIVVLGSQAVVKCEGGSGNCGRPEQTTTPQATSQLVTTAVCNPAETSSRVGKTSLVVRYIGKMFSKHISPTIGASFFTCNISVDDARVKLQVWDTAGQERFRSMAPMYYRNANAALLVFDISSAASFAAIKGWVKELQSNVPEPMVVSVVGNKCDLVACRAVTHSEAAQYAASIGAQYAETSALHDQGIDQVFLSTATSLLKMSASNGAIRSYDSAEGDSDRIPTGSPTEETATHTGKVELPAWSIDSIAHGELQKNMCC